METIANFVGDNYGWFLTISIILLFSLIGYIYDSKRNKNDLIKKNEQEIEDLKLEELQSYENKGLGEMIDTTKNINQETKQVELIDKTILEGNNEEPMPNIENKTEVIENNNIENLTDNSNNPNVIN